MRYEIELYLSQLSLRIQFFLFVRTISSKHFGYKKENVVGQQLRLLFARLVKGRNSVEMIIFRT